MQTTATKTEPARLPTRVTAATVATITVAAALIGFGINRALWPTHIPMPTTSAVIGDKVHDGRLAFTVTNVRHDVKSVGDRYFGASADHRFTVVDMQVTNYADSTQTFDASYIGAFDSAGQRVPADREAGYYANESEDDRVGTLQPGNSVHVVLVFDTTRAGQPVLLEVHDSAFSSGEPISLHR